MRTLQINRFPRYISSMIAYSIIIDGQQVGLLTNGKSAAYAIDERQHTLTVGDMIMYKRFSATVTIPAGNANYIFNADTKFTGKIVMTLAAPVAPASVPAQQPPVYQAPVYQAPVYEAPTYEAPAYQAPQDPVNELDQYHPGGAGYLRPSVGEIDRMGIREAESYMIGDTLGTLLSSGCIDVRGEHVQSVARECGASIGSTKARFNISEGACSYSTTFYADTAFQQEIVMNPYVQTFDWMISTIGEQRQCKALSHDLDMIRRVALTIVAMECPNAWMIDGVLYSQKP